MIQTSQTVLDGTNRRDPTIAFLDMDTKIRPSNGRIKKDVQKWNWTDKRKHSSLLKKCLLVFALMEVIRTTLGNHIYQFNEEDYRELFGGPIGVNLTNMASKLVMFTFLSRYWVELVNLQLYNKVVLPKIYVDNQN